MDVIVEPQLMELVQTVLDGDERVGRLTERTDPGRLARARSINTGARVVAVFSVESAVRTLEEIVSALAGGTGVDVVVVHGDDWREKLSGFLEPERRSG
jgi:hypothetical protein